jgi:CBS-domain-containing membrane protein
MLTVNDIMSRQVYAVEAEASAEEAAWGMTRRHIGGVPVRDHEGAIVGVLTKGDLVNPEPAQWIKGEATAEDLMNPDLFFLHRDDPALTAATEMARHHVHRMIVLDNEQHLVGIVSSMDIVRAVAEGHSFAV